MTNSDIIYIRRPKFRSKHSIVEMLCKKLSLTKSPSSTPKCTILTNDDIIISVRPKNIDIVILDNKGKKQSIYEFIVNNMNL